MAGLGLAGRIGIGRLIPWSRILYPLALWVLWFRPVLPWGCSADGDPAHLGSSIRRLSALGRDLSQFCFSVIPHRTGTGRLTAAVPVHSCRKSAVTAMNTVARSHSFVVG